MTIHTEDQLQEPQAEPKATPAKRPARTAKNAPAGESQPKPRPARKKPQRAQPEPVQESAPEPAAVAELVTAAPEAYDPAPALSAPCSEPCPETCSAPAAETAELHAALGEDQLQLREALMGHLQGFKMVAAVPVNCRATNHFRHFRIVQRLADPVEHPLLVVIPDQQADVLQMMAL